MTKTISDYNSTVNQRIKGEFVRREVVQNCSMLVSCFYADPGMCSSGYSWEDDVLPICQKDDYSEPILAHLEEKDEEELNEMRDLWNIEATTPEAILAELKENEDDLEYACEAGLDPDIVEALEHWIVSDHLARKLEQHGEMVGFDFFGLTIWGRTTSGQAIKLDHVISVICEEMGILEGQKYQWEV